LSRSAGPVHHGPAYQNTGSPGRFPTQAAPFGWRLGVGACKEFDSERLGMMRQRPSMGFLGRFGRSSDLRQLDDALRALDLHPNLVPEPVKITVVNLLKDPAGDGTPPAAAYAQAAEIVAYCMVGGDGFTGANGEHATRRVESRIEAALKSGDSLDAQLILLTLHAGVIQPSVVDRFKLESE
jgi:hypothetical protein